MGYRSAWFWGLRLPLCPGTALNQAQLNLRSFPNLTSHLGYTRNNTPVNPHALTTLPRLELPPGVTRDQDVQQTVAHRSKLRAGADPSKSLAPPPP